MLRTVLSDQLHNVMPKVASEIETFATTTTTMQQQQRGKPEGELRAIRVVNFTHLILSYKTCYVCSGWLGGVVIQLKRMS